MQPEKRRALNPTGISGGSSVLFNRQYGRWRKGLAAGCSARQPDRFERDIAAACLAMRRRSCRQIHGGLHREPGVPTELDNQTFTLDRRRATGLMAAAARIGLLISNTEALPLLSPVVIVEVL